MATWDQKEQANGPRWEDEEACLRRSAESAQQTQTVQFPPTVGV